MFDNVEPEADPAPSPIRKLLFVRWVLLALVIVGFCAAPVKSRFNRFVPRRSRSAPNLNVLFFNDIHIDQNYLATGTVTDHCRIANPAPNASYAFGQYGCDSPKLLLASLFTAAPKFVPSPDYIFFAGDAPPHWYDQTRNDVLSYYDLINQMFDSTYPGVPVYNAIGNHDFVPTWGHFETDQEDFENVVQALTTLTPSEKATFRQGGYYYHDFGNIRILFLNTVMYSRNTTDTDPWGQFAWMDTVCPEALAQGMTIGVVCHIPPGVQKIGSKAGWYTQFIESYHDRVQKYNIRFSLNGHSHEDQFLPSEESDAARYFLSAPSVSPVDGNNPGFRLYQIGVSDVLNYQQYYADILTNPVKDVTWELEYDFREFYNATDASPESLRKVTEFVQKDPAGRWKYKEMMYARAVQDGGFYYCQMKCTTIEEMYNCRKLLAQDMVQD
jgi:sphingomyelin phosphodiesterase acid-like 3